MIHNLINIENVFFRFDIETKTKKFIFKVQVYFQLLINLKNLIFTII